MGPSIPKDNGEVLLTRTMNLLLNNSSRKYEEEFEDESTDEFEDESKMSTKMSPKMSIKMSPR
ncbi:hypothetical protein H5410_049747 [Solanum commersonii]|uniref:Uncharacterized protein n=1 Tax=Solanum commersonii TaxID=4109 RepID=A0A9J5WVW3_SOLCO|nr:hypothetical protein H5410_049747 [Solanum commersonii]